MGSEGMDEQLTRYLTEKRIGDLFKTLLLQICVERPEDPKAYIVRYLSPSVPVQAGAPSSVGSGSGGVDNTPNLDSPNVATDDSQSEASASMPTRPMPTPKAEGKPGAGGSASKRNRRGGVSGASTNAMSSGTLERKTMIPKDQATLLRLDKTLQRSVMFSMLEQEDRLDVFDAMFEVNYRAGDTIIRQGDEGDNFYVLDQGCCEIYVQREDKDPELVMTVFEGGTFGELALMYDQPRAATVKAKIDCRLWAIDRFTYSRTVMAGTMKKRKQFDLFLQKVPILSAMTKYERMTVADALEAVNFQENDVIVRQGEKGDAFYLIMEGEVNVSQVDQQGQTKNLCRLGPSGYFGELALMMNRPRAATVAATCGLKTVKLTADRFSRVLGPCEEILRRNIEAYNLYMAQKL